MSRDIVALMSQPAVEYAHLPGEEHNPLMESTAHVDWTIVLLNASRHALAHTDDLVTGNVPFDPGDGLPRPAPDVMVIPGAIGRDFGCYVVGRDGPMPTVCVEILSPSNTRAQIRRRCRRFLGLGIGEVYVLDPIRDTVVHVTVIDDEISETTAVGRFSPGLNLTFTRSGGRLAVCCAAGRTVRPGDDPFGWLDEEMRRADRAEARHDQLSAELDAMSAEKEEARVDAEQARVDAERALQEARVATERVRELEAQLAALHRDD